MRDTEGVARRIREAETIAVCSHISPDGDTIGSALAMRLVLLHLGKKVQCFCQDKVPDNLFFLPGVDEIHSPAGNTDHFDLMLSVDVSDPARLGECLALKERSLRTAQIDHHGTNPLFMEVNSVDGKAAATCTMIAEQMKVLEVPMTREIAMCLYAGISTDTGNFSFSCTDAESFRVAAELLEAGLPLARLSRILFRQMSRPQLRLLGRAIEKMVFRGSGDVAVMTLTRQDFTDCHAMSEHADTIVNYGLETIGTRMALLAREAGDGSVKFSLRAIEPLAVAGVANRLGGGGHPQAAGVTMHGSLEECVEQVLAEMMKELQKAGN